MSNNDIGLNINNDASIEFWRDLPRGNILTDASTNIVYTNPRLIEFGNTDHPSKDIIFNIEGGSVQLTNILDENRDLKARVENLEETNDKLEKRVKELAEIINQIYYAPGGPGYLQAQQSFVEQQK